MPNIQVKLRRGTTSQHAGFTGAEGEVTVDTDKDTVIVHDGTTAGGHELRRKDDTIAGSEIDNDAVDTAQIAADAVTSTEIAANAVTSSEIATDAVGTDQIAADAVTSSEISSTDTTFKVAATEVVVNEGGADVDFRVEGDNNINLINANGQNDIVGIGVEPDATDTFSGGTTYKAQIKDGAKIENDTGTAKLKLVSNKTGGGVASISLISTTPPATDEGNYSIFIGQALGRYNITNESTSKALVMDKTGSWLPGEDYNASTNPSQNLGDAGARWSTVYANTGTINTSDRNEKEQIQDLSEAELRVAKTIKGLVKKFKFKEGKRTHVGVIAQDVEAAFTAEGLNAREYGLFCSDTFKNEQGITITRLGIRYEELLAFVIAAL